MVPAPRYRLGRRLAAGGMGEVFLARVHGPHGFTKTVAVKRVLRKFSQDPAFAERFIREATLAVSLTHANLVQVLDLARGQDDLLLVMEYVHGADLQKVLRASRQRQEPLPLPHVIHFASHVLQGLSYAHELSVPGAPSGVVHCDISTSNVLISYAGEVKVTDFGIARGTAQLRNQPIMGKPSYMAPEQLRGDVLDGRADLYSVGVLIKRLLVPGEKLDPAETNLRFRDLSLPGPFRALVEAATEFEPADRPNSARQMLSELTQISRSLTMMVTGPEVGSWLRELVPPGPEGLEATVEEAAAFEVDTLLGEHSLVLPPTTPVEPTLPSTPPRTPTVSVSLAPTPPLPPRVESSSPGIRWALAAILLTAVIGGAAVVSYLSLSPTKIDPQADSRPLAVPVEERPTPPPALPPTSTGTLTVEAPPPVAPSSGALGSTPRASPSRRPTTGRRSVGRKGRLNVYVEPWAQVSIDGRKVGTSPLMGLSLTEGQHRVVLEHPGLPPMVRLVSIRSGETELLDVTLGR